MPIQAGSFTVLANFVGSADYTLASALANFTINLTAVPCSTWPSPANIVYGTPLSGTQLDATSSVPGTFIYSPAAGTILHTGQNQTLSVTFTPTDAADYKTATIKKDINVSPGLPTVTWAVAPITFPTPLGPVQLDASASVAGTYVYTPAVNTTLTSGLDQVLSVTFTPTDAADYSTVKKTTMINVLPASQKATPIITWPDPAGIVYGTPLGATQLNATANVSGTFAYAKVASGTIWSAGVNQPLAVAFTPTDTTDYTTASKSVTIDVAKGTATITWANPAGIVYGTPLYTRCSSTRTRTCPGRSPTLRPRARSFMRATPRCCRPPSHPTTRPITPPRHGDHQRVARHADDLVGPTRRHHRRHTPGGAVQLDATASVPGVFTYEPAAGTLMGAGPGQVLSVTFTPNDPQDYAITGASAIINVIAAPILTPTPPQVEGVIGASQTKGLTAITVAFDQVLESESVSNPAFYSVLGAVKKHRKTVYSKVVRIKGISFDGGNRVTINFAKPYKGAVMLSVHRGILADDGASSIGDFSTVVD